MGDAWMQTSSGRAVDMLDPRPEDVDTAEIAHALSLLCRYNGHTRRFYSVAEHCVHVALWLERNLAATLLPERRATIALAGLLHDASEAYTGDLTWPVQAAMSRAAVAEFKAMQRRFDDLIEDLAGLERGILHHPLVKEVDIRILVDERDALLGPPPQPWFADQLGGLGVQIDGWEPEKAYLAWSDTYYRLQLLRRGGVPDAA